MDIVRGCAEVLFSKIPYEIAEVSIPESVFCLYSQKVFPQYNDNELKYIYENQVMNKPVFDVAFDIADAVLSRSNGSIVCNHKDALRWRDVSFKLGQDIFVTAFLAKRDLENGTETKIFSWLPVIDMKNEKLNRRLLQGIAENHFHLHGSSRTFSLSFCCLMNNIYDRQEHFDKIIAYLDTHQDYNAKDHVKRSLYGKCIIAAALRLHLFTVLEKGVSIFEERGLSTDKLDEYDASKTLDLQEMINSCQLEHGYNKNMHYPGAYLDYAYNEEMASDGNNNQNRALTGERRFLYKCFYRTLQGGFSETDKKYFYKYLLIKNSFRNELVQTNFRVGFKNFSNYQDRKEIFIYNYPQYEYELIRLAVSSTLSDGYTKSLEARICPKEKSVRNENALNLYDKIAADDNKPPFKHFYVFHFPKNTDKEYKTPYEPRHFKKRNKIMKCARAIVAMLEGNNRLRERIRGIDACSNEIGCRPEVFAHSFRYLMNTQIRPDMSIPGHNMPAKLNATYHVGEDFLDIADGLRAIDEVINYLGFKKGNRFGHALALGLNTDNYYKRKRMQLVMTKQDAFDNIVWLLERGRTFHININSDLNRRLLKMYNILLKEIYDLENVSTHCFFQAWKLRGDDPRYYWGGTPSGTAFLESDKFRLNPEKELESIRRDFLYSQLYFRYHYDVKVKEKGSETNIFHVDENYMNLLKNIQYEMQKYIKGLGISIESNPSSNYLIGNLEKYEDHPIFSFYDINGTRDSNLSVSINTDDQGVFETSLQNEYALLALALEKRKLYSQEKILTYLNNVRQSGFEQVFK